MEEMGQFLRRTREDRGLTLEEAAEATKIRRAYLEAIERGDWSALPPAVYARGFVRSYAEFLGLDGNEVLVRAGMSTPPPTPQGPPPDQDEGGPAKANRYRQAIPQVAASVLLLAALAGGYWFLADRDSGPAPSTSEPGGPTALPTRQSATEPPPKPQPPQPDLQVVKRNASQYMVNVGRVDQLEVSLKVERNPCWIDAEADGHSVEQRTLQPGETRTFTGNQEVRIVAGRASSLTVTVNGQPLDPVTSDVLTYTVKKSTS
ncbi:MAG: helix-turn-helix domain-containing protein [Kyrpidia sp.]|nr:helix-turn-helix domain-containing protein [Kyrpidia sp.]